MFRVLSLVVMSHRSQTTKKQKRKRRQPLGCGHLPAPVTDEDAGPQYLFVVVSHKDNKESYLNPGYFSSILQLETPQTNNPEYGPNLAPEEVKPKQVKEKEYVARFSQVQVGPSPIGWLFSPPSSSSEDLYIMPDCTLEDYYIHVGAPLHGFKLNMRNLKIYPIISPTASKLRGHAVNREGHIYFMAHPDSYYETPDPVFECYDPVESKWKAIEPFPDHDVRPSRHSIAATAVWDDIILYFMGYCKIWAYNVHKNKWYEVTVKDGRCYKIVGEAVVVKNTIYALSVAKVPLDLVLALSIEREEIDGEPKFICSLLSEYSVQGMDQFISEHAKAFQITRHLVHLGEDNFCFVRSCNRSGLNRYQPIQLTSIKLTGEGLIVTGVCVYEVELYSDKQFRALIKEAEQLQTHHAFVKGIYNEIAHFQDILGSKHDLQFEVRLCFTLPECKTNAVKHGERPRYHLDPFPFVDDASNNKDKTEGFCIRIRNVPPSATIKQLESDAHFFGYSSSGMRVVMNNTGIPSAIVEYESFTTKHAIKVASSVKIGDGLSLEERTFGICLYFPYKNGFGVSATFDDARWCSAFR